MKNIAIVGMGKMGSAIESRIAGDYNVAAVRHGDSLRQLEGADVVILAVKPQVFNQEPGLADELRLHACGQLFLSVMAGIKTKKLRGRLGTDRVARAMTTLAARAGEAPTAWYSEDEGIDAHAVQTLTSMWGSSVRLADEALFDPFTAVFGSGPGYIYKFMSYLQDEAVARGFEPEQAWQMANQMLRGAASLVDPTTSFDELAGNVASKGGTTEAGFNVFDGCDLRGITREAIGAACLRSQELGQD